MCCNICRAAPWNISPISATSNIAGTQQRAMTAIRFTDATTAVSPRSRTLTLLRTLTLDYNIALLLRSAGQIRVRTTGLFKPISHALTARGSCVSARRRSVPLNNCAHQCFNTPGSYYCNCSNGYQLADDQGSCNDIDECGANHDCSQQCINTHGSYNCSCYNGYQLNDDQFTCDDIDECEENSDDCSQLCSNTMGLFKCDCRDEFFLTRDGKTCEDLPTGSPLDVQIGAVQALLSNSTNEFQNSRSVFSQTVTREVMDYCRRSSAGHCGHITIDNVSKLYFQVASLVSQNSSIMVTFYVFSINLSTQQIYIIPADHVVSALTGSNALQQAGYPLLSLDIAFPPTTEPMTESNSSDTSSSKAPLIGAIVGSMAGVVLLLLTVFCIWRCKKGGKAYAI